MAEPPLPIALMAGHAARRGEVRRLARLVDLLAGRGVAARVLVAGGAEGLQDEGVDAREVPWLDRAWLLRLAFHRGPIVGPGPRPTLVHALHDEVAVAASTIASRWGVPMVRTIEGGPANDHAPRPNPRGLAAVVVGDEGLARDLAACDHLPVDLVRVIAPGVAPPPVDEPPGPDGPGGPTDGRVPVIGTMGFLGPGSGFESFLDAIRRVVESGRDVEFLVAALGPGEARVRRRAARLEIADRLTFAGPSALESAFWRVVDVYCQPSAAPAIARPLCLAMAAGKSCVAFDVEGPRSLLDRGGRGLLVPPGDAAALARALLTLLEQPSLARSLADRARSWSLLRFDPEAEADALASLYARVAAAGP